MALIFNHIDPEFYPIIIIGSIFIIVALIAAYAIRLYEKKRTEKLRLLCRKHGWTFMPKISNITLPFEIFNEGRNNETFNIIKTKLENRQWEIFDQKYTVGYGKSQHTYKFTIIKTASNKLIPFSLKPEKTYHKIFDLISKEDIDFKDYPKFSRDYLLKGAEGNEEQIRKLFSPTAIKWLEENKPNISIESSNNMIIFYNRSRRIKPESINESIKKYSQFLSQLIGKEEF